MELDPYSRAVVKIINASGVIPFHQFHPVEARAALLKLRAERPAVPVHPMWKVSEESVITTDGGWPGTRRGFRSTRRGWSLRVTAPAATSRS